MWIFIKVAIIITLGLLISLLVILQPTKEANALSGLSGSGSKLFSNDKKRGVEGVLFRITAILGVLLFVALLVF